MKRTMTALIIFGMMIMAASCTKSDDAAKKDIDFLYGTIEYVWNTTVEYTRKGQADQGLDLCEKYVAERQTELAAAGKRMSEFMFQDKVRLYYAERNQKNRALTDKWEDYISNNLNGPQMARWNRIIAELIVEKYMKNIEWTTDPVEFFKKGIKGNM